MFQIRLPTVHNRLPCVCASAWRVGMLVSGASVRVGRVGRRLLRRGFTPGMNKLVSGRWVGAASKVFEGLACRG